MHFNIADLDKHFPMESYREGQKECLEFACKAFNDGKRIVILECPTGSGKSCLAMTLADMVDTSYYLTSTKQLQDQLVGDFGDQIVELKGRNAYPCTWYDRVGPEMVRRKAWTLPQLAEQRQNHDSCANGYCKTGHNKNQKGASSFKCKQCFTKQGPTGIGGKSAGDLTVLPPGMTYSACPYYERVYAAIHARKVVMNFSSFLFQTQMTKRFDEPRDIICIDEAHNCESQLLDFVSLSISDHLLQKQSIYIPQLDSAQAYAVWFDEIRLDHVIMDLIKEAKENDDGKKEDELNRLLRKYKLFIDNIVDPESEWVAEYEEGKSSRKVTLKPVFVKTFAEPLLLKYAKRIVLMSATILDVDILCRSLGIDRSTVAAYRMKNRFPVKNRPIFVEPVAKMTGGKNSMHEWGPLLIKKVNEIVVKYPGKRGIIHTHNFAIMDLLVDKCSHAVRSRFLTQKQFKDKSEMLLEHGRRQDTIIVAPAMHEGLNLTDDLSRFAIIAKIPFPNCFDNAQLARRVEIDRHYYNWLVALKLVQSTGRSVRSETDYADTYIIDESIYKFIRETRKMLPEWFLETLQGKGVAECVR